MTDDDEKSNATPLAILAIVGVGLLETSDPYLGVQNIDYNNSVSTASDEKSVNLE
ncbi:uncharacterized protein RSE6_11733 [Rhynchosporium secalis]|uniref:Uncharacterized protein n=1 Tax=Rhynchosporium secalis TaxID=38038 RepID=A0A1E1MNM6_RHYSE|nr:uncharacterized protein RSE6_11733 [Rhynchosporium secalis]